MPVCNSGLMSLLKLIVHASDRSATIYLEIVQEFRTKAKPG